MKSTKKIVFGLIILIGWYLFKVYSAAKGFTYSRGSITNFKIRIAEGLITWTQGINVTNGDNIPVFVNAVSLKNSVNGSLVGTSILEKSFQIPPRDTTEMKIMVSIPFDDLGGVSGSLMNAFRTGQITMRFFGFVWSLGIKLPIDQKFSLSIPKLNF